MPVAGPFPDLLHVVLVGRVPVKYGGRTASILTKCQALYELGGVRSLILTTSRAVDLPEAVEAMRARGHLGDGVDVRNLLDFYPDASSVVPTDADASDLRPLRTADGRRELLFDDRGVYRACREYDPEGRLLAQDWFTADRTRSRREEFADDGRLVRTAYFDRQSGTRRQDVHYRRDGSAMFSHWTSPPPTSGGWLKDDRVVLFDEDGNPQESVAGTFAPVAHRCLDEAIAGRPAVLSVEARFVDRFALDYERPNVRSVYVLHSSHLKEPGDDPSAVRGSFRALFEQADEVPAVVFLTDSQRAEAEDLLGRHDSFEVIPHSSPAPRLDGSVRREPALVVMVGRLSREKRFGHGIDAFAKLLEGHPDARLEIYGEGPERKALQRKIDRSGLAGSVRLMGFTSDPGLVYQRAAACLLTSSFEGAPLVLVEALRHGCPVLAYDIRYGPADIVENGVNGFLVPAGDTAALARRLGQLLDDPDLHARLVAGATRAEQRFGPQAFVARWSALFNRLADDMTPRPTSAAGERDSE